MNRILVLLAVVMITAGIISAQVRVQDSLALVDLYNSTNGTGWTDNTGWLSGSPYDTWYGVSVIENRVQTLDLKQNNLTGSIPSSIGDLTGLRNLTLYTNNLSGGIPSTLGALINLTTLNLHANQLSGTIPAAVWSLTTLKVLSLQSNSLSGTIPSDIGNLSALINLRLADNQFTGAIPAALWGLTGLTILDLGGNQFTGTIPASIGNLTSLNTLDLGPNMLTGSIPAQVWDLTGLTWLHLNGNQLSGTLTSDIGDLTALTHLKLSDNQLTGTLPGALGNCTQLVQLILDNNQFSGSIPAQLGSLTGLTQLFLNENQLTGTIPAQIGNLTELTQLNLSDNQLSGAVPAQIANLTSLSSLALFSNQLTGLPDLSPIKTIMSLLLQDNQFTFEDIEPNAGVSGLHFTYAPQDSIGSAGDTTLDVYQSLTLTVSTGGTSNRYQWKRDGISITGATENILAINSIMTFQAGAYICEVTNSLAPDLTIYTRPYNVSVVWNPLTLDSLALVAVYTSTEGAGWTDNTNWLTGGISTWYGVTVTGGRVTALTLDNNNLVKRLPENIGNLTALTYLSLNDNDLYRASLPEAICGLDSLRYLSMNNCNLTTAIPAEIGNLTKLEYLSLRNNTLNGLVPAEITGLTVLRNLHLDGNRISGLIDLSPLTGLDTVQVQNNQLTFEDIEPNLDFSGSDFTYIPQPETLGSALNWVKMVGDTLKLDTRVGGDSSVYQWTLDGSVISGAAGDTFVIDSLALADSGLYACMVTNTVIPGLTFYLELANVSMVVITDSLVLVDLYNSTNGGTWMAKTNWLQGSIKNWIGITATWGGKVTAIELPNNNLTGTLPASLGALSDLEKLSLYNNNLTGPLPKELGSLKNLTALWLWNNQLSGEIPKELGNLKKLGGLHLNENQLTGAIPEELGDLPSLSYLELQNNQLSGTLPASLGDLVNLGILEIDSNQISGTIPSSYVNLTNLREIRMSGNQLTGTVPAFGAAFTRLTDLDLRGNSLSGAVPPELADAPVLRRLYLADNKLEDLPDLTPHLIYDLRIQNNRFTFEDIEPNVSISSLYAPQDSIGSSRDVVLEVGEYRILSVSVGGDSNYYQWSRDGTDLNGRTDSSLVIGNTAFTDSGSHICRITNTVAAECTLYSRPVNVTVILPLPDVPVLNSPDSAATGIARPPVLSWTKTHFAGSYRLRIGTAPDINSAPVLDTTGLPGTSMIILGLAGGTEYFWQVAAVNATGEGEMSAVWSFTTFPDPPGVPLPAAPASGSSGVDNPPTLAWHPAAGADSYRLLIGTDSYIPSALVLDTAGITDTVFTPDGLSYTTQYFWQVFSANLAGESAGSYIWNFTITATKVQVPYQAADGQVRLHAGNGIITYSLPAASGVDISIRSLSGRSVWEYRQDRLEPGEYRVCPGESVLPTGIYIFSFKAGDQYYEGKLAIVK